MFVQFTPRLHVHTLEPFRKQTCALVRACMGACVKKKTHSRTLALVCASNARDPGRRTHTHTHKHKHTHTHIHTHTHTHTHTRGPSQGEPSTTGGQSPPVAEMACEDHDWERIFLAPPTLRAPPGSPEPREKKKKSASRAS